MKLVKVRNSGMSSHTWFYKNDQGHIVSPFFDSDIEARAWFDQAFEMSDDVDKFGK